MRFIKVENLKYVNEDKSLIDLEATNEKGEVFPMSLNLVDTEDIHTFYDTKDNKEYSLEEYCKTQDVKEYENIQISENFKAWQESLQELEELKEYLKSTDFYYVRLAETGEEVPVEVITKRTEARNRIRELEDMQYLEDEELENESVEDKLIEEESTNNDS